MINAVFNPGDAKPAETHTQRHSALIDACEALTVFSSLVCGRVGTPPFSLTSAVFKAVMPGALAIAVLRPLSGALGLTAFPVSVSDPAPRPRTRGQ